MEAESGGEGADDGDPSLLRIGDVARSAGVSRRTVDFYTARGLIEPVGRTEGNYRLYTPDAVDRIVLIKRLEEQGVALDEIAAALHDLKGQDAESRLREVDRDLHRLLRSVHGLAAAGGTEANGLVSALVTRLQSLVGAAIDVTGGKPPPI